MNGQDIVNNKVFNYMKSAVDKTNVDLSGQVPPKPEFSDIVSEIYSEMPVLKQHGFVVKKVDKLHKDKKGSIEFMSPLEPKNPYGKPYVELYKNAPTEKSELKKAIWGDMLHHLSSADPYWKSLRNEYMGARDKRQKEFDRKKYKEEVAQGEKRSFEKWMDVSWADASVREPLKGNKQWLGFQTEKQKNILKKMENYLKTGKRK